MHLQTFRNWLGAVHPPAWPVVFIDIRKQHVGPRLPVRSQQFFIDRYLLSDVDQNTGPSDQTFTEPLAPPGTTGYSVTSRTRRSSAARVPEPASLYLVGFGAVCGSVFVMGHKRRERRSRNDRRVATNRQGQVGGATVQATPVVLRIPRVRSLSTEAIPPDVSPDVDHIHILLIKPGHPFDAPFHRLRGNIQPRRGKRIAQEIKAPADPSDEGLVGVLLNVPLPDHDFPGGDFSDFHFQPFFPAPLGKSKSHT